MKFKFFLSLIFYFLILNNNSHAELYDKIKIKLDPFNFGKYQKSIIRAYVEEGQYIKKKHKKWIKGKILLGEKKLNIKLRITGDWEDHLRQEEYYSKVYSSIYVKVINDNFQGMTRFKILLPETRRGNYHIFWNNLLNFYGYKSLKIKLVKVMLNDISYIGMIEEVPSKEFLETNLEREVPILEFDERIYWQNQKNIHRVRNYIKNQVSIFDDPVYRPHNSPKIINKKYLKNQQSVRIASDAIYLFSLNNFEKYMDNSEFFYEITKKYASHGLKLANRNFYYQPYKFKLFEIYKEGNVKLRNMDEIKDCDLTEENKLDIKDFIKKYNFQFRLDKKMSCAFLDVQKIYKNKQKKTHMPILSKDFNIKENKRILIEKIIHFLETNLSTKITEDDLQDNFTSNLIQKYSLLYKNKSYLCEYNIDNQKIVNCELLNQNDYTEIISGEDQGYISGGMKLFPINLGNLSFKNNVIFSDHTNNKSIYNLTESSTYILNFAKNNLLNDDTFKDIYFNFNNDNARLIIQGNLKGYNLNFNNKQNTITEIILNNIKEGRFNQKNLTGCITFLDVTFENTNLNAKNFMCEDAINILNSKGKINKIQIESSLFDALDIDFSDVSIQDIIIRNAKNDCLDFSSGFYNIKNINLSNCLDKGISAGEKSIVKIENANITYSDIAVASKDSSDTKIGTLFVDSSNVCLSAYRKKQEFSGSKLNVNSLKCSNYLKKLEIDNFSKIRIEKNN